MIDPKFYPYFTDEKTKTEHGYEYIVLKATTPQEIKNEYMGFVMRQDKRIANGERVFR